MLEENIMEDVIPSEIIKRMIRWWWLVLLIMIVGGAAGILAVKLQKPVYESQASITTSIDYAYAGRITEAQEDALVSVIGDEISSTAVFDVIKQKAVTLDITLTDEIIKNQFTKSRQGYRWELTVRNTDPQIAQTLTQLWVDSADEELAKFEAKSQEILAMRSAQLALQNCFSQSVVVEPASSYCSTENLATLRDVLAESSTSQKITNLPSAILLSSISTEKTDDAYIPTSPVLLKQNLSALAGSFCGLLVGLGFLFFGKNKKS
jgi:uncharacterized protein involved in exopolysaccharide biosynthesis